MDKGPLFLERPFDVLASSSSFRLHRCLLTIQADAWLPYGIGVVGRELLCRARSDPLLVKNSQGSALWLGGDGGVGGKGLSLGLGEEGQDGDEEEREKCSAGHG
jgi:hypothetical protein